MAFVLWGSNEVDYLSVGVGNDIAVTNQHVVLAAARILLLAAPRVGTYCGNGVTSELEAVIDIRVVGDIETATADIAG